MYILPYKFRYTSYTLFLFLQRVEEEVECKKQVYQENIMLNNPSTILHTSDEEMRHAHSSNDDSYLSDECQSINAKIQWYHFV